MADPAKVPSPMILVVEDEPTARELRIKAFEDLGCGVIGAASADEAIAALASRSDIDLVLTDIHMGPEPGDASGITLARYAKHDYPDLPIIGYSAVFGDADLGRDVELFDSVWTKGQLTYRTISNMVELCRERALLHRRDRERTKLSEAAIEPLLEDVFKQSGIPTVTFVRPTDFERLLVALRTPGRGVVVEGPSGIGKTTAITTALRELGLSGAVRKLTPRVRADVSAIAEIAAGDIHGVVVVDDFHRLAEEQRDHLANVLKVLADEDAMGAKLVLLGTNRVGDRLISVEPDLASRIDVIQLETEPDDSVRALVELGEAALNISFSIRDELVAAAAGSFSLAQMMCFEACLACRPRVLSRLSDHRSVQISYEAIVTAVMKKLAPPFQPRARAFSMGPRFNRHGRAPYLHLLRALAEGCGWHVSIDAVTKARPGLRPSMGQIIERGHLVSHLARNPQLADVLHYDQNSRVLSIEDPQFAFYIRHIAWRGFGQEMGYAFPELDTRYDFAFSFAGEDREYADALFGLLTAREFAVFYDKNEQHRILAENVADYLEPIYRSEATFVVLFVSLNYANRIWTKFEAEAFRERFKDHVVVPIWFKGMPRGFFDESAQVGSVEFDPSHNVATQLEGIADLLTLKIGEHRLGSDISITRRTPGPTARAQSVPGDG